MFDFFLFYAMQSNLIFDIKEFLFAVSLHQVSVTTITLKLPFKEARNYLIFQYFYMKLLN